MRLIHLILPHNVIAILRKIILTQSFFLPIISISYGYSEGGISLDQTRVVYLSTSKAQTLTVNNTSQRAWLIQSRVQSGENTSKAPFIITPPLFTLQPDSQQLLRMMKTNHALPEDRESLFYLSVLAIPAAKAKEADSLHEGVISVGMNFTIKMFYRPRILSQGIEQAPCQLRFIQTPKGIHVENPTPYFQTFGKLLLNGNAFNLNEASSMLAPFGQHQYDINKGTVKQIQWQTINDYGGLSEMCIQNMGEEKA
ncbi:MULTISPECIES: molecular chaperone [Providencia]|uniref:Molecular chaperone n=1 Tax=Providencia rettgeri TaxID=587 RepID=A0A219X574_PRORE|nr:MULTISPECIES: molecular chaperone [Providencia]APC14125.1 Chaperone protein focC precursor,long polar fimbrial chaperone LpfB,Gram-negative pili assembly chaperone, N-terminal domain [Providencia rettgeri]MBG5929386.1 molecular chaperone [Providencia rettgeri]MBN6367249.1 molecular chaperone [Providencia rettgeri]OZS73049.1 hypothetical protein CHI95_18830 [Providencia rettgeri]